MTGTVTKWLYLKLDDGRVYRIDSHLIAHDYATYYSSDICVEDPGDYDEEYSWCIQDTDELQDWAMNNLDWWTLAEYVRTDYIDPKAGFITDYWLEDIDD